MKIVLLFFHEMRTRRLIVRVAKKLLPCSETGQEEAGYLPTYRPGVGTRGILERVFGSKSKL